MQIVVTFQDRSLSDYANRLEALSAGSGRAVLASALNQAGGVVRHKTVQAETAQTGLPSATIDRAQHEIEADGGSLRFTIVSRGGDVRLKFFGAKESGGGVVAHPWNKSVYVAGAFTQAGFHGVRKALPWGGEVKQRVGSGRLPLKTVHSGLFIPEEMTKGSTAKAFDAGFQVMASTIVSRLGSLLP